MKKTYIAIDLKSFYASVECVERNLDPLNTNLVVADNSRTEKTICLAVSPSLKSFGIPGRARLFEVIQKVKEINLERKKKNKNYQEGQSYYLSEINNNPNLAIDYIVATPRMAHYIKYSTKIYGIYLKYFAPEDIHVYSIDEVFIDATRYLKNYKMSPYDLTLKIIRNILKETGVTATAGIAPNLFLCKVAMDIFAKKIVPDKDGVRIAELDVETYRKLLWDHKPLTDFWRIGRGYANKLESMGLYTMGDIALFSLKNEDFLYKVFGINAELLIDHAWGIEPCTMENIKKYRPMNKSIGTGQVLHEAYSSEKGLLITKEMIELLSLDLVDKKLLTSQIVLTVGYDIENLKNSYNGEIMVDYYGREIPKHAHGTINLKKPTASTIKLTDAIVSLYKKIVDPALMVRRINISANRLMLEENYNKDTPNFQQLGLVFDNNNLKVDEQLEIDIDVEKEKRAQLAILKIKKKYGKNAIVKGMNLEEGATSVDRNKQIGGHKA